MGFDRLSPNGCGFDRLSPNGCGFDRLSPNGCGFDRLSPNGCGFYDISSNDGDRACCLGGCAAGTGLDTARKVRRYPFVAMVRRFTIAAPLVTLIQD